MTTLDQRSRPLGFLDLPPELRNMIYMQCLTLLGDVRIEGTPSHWPLHVYAKPWSEAPLQPNILLTCRTVNSEATQILYGSNTYVLRIICPGGCCRCPDICLTGCRSFLLTWPQRIGRSIKYLRVVKISGHNLHILGSVLHSLAPAAMYLDRIVISISNFWASSREAFVQVLLGFVRCLKRYHDVDPKTALELLQFEFGPTSLREWRVQYSAPAPVTLAVKERTAEDIKAIVREGLQQTSMRDHILIRLDHVELIGIG